eukprot:SAG31_NODE_3204_length_4559_cov_1.961211_1_plen_162_part_00
MGGVSYGRHRRRHRGQRQRQRRCRVVKDMVLWWFRASRAGECNNKFQYLSRTDESGFRVQLGPGYGRVHLGTQLYNFLTVADTSLQMLLGCAVSSFRRRASSMGPVLQLLAALCACTASSPPPPVFPGRAWARAAPAALGLNATKLDAFRDFLGRESHGKS